MFSKSTLLTVAFAGLAASAPLLKRAHQGTATYYAVGLGNCGGHSSPGDMVVALNTAMYGPTSQKSSYCGQTVHITNEKTGKSQDATIVDSCPTCGGSGDLDMSSGLFSALGGTQSEGVFPISWTIGSGSSSSSSSSNNNNNNNNNNQQQSSSSQSTPSKTSAAASSSAPSPTAPKSSNPKDSGVVPTDVTPKKTDTGAVSWWAEIDSRYCGFTPADNETVAAIAPSSNYNGTDLSQTCGKYIKVYNDDNGKSVTARVASWMPDAEKGSLVLTDGYKDLTTMNGQMPVPIDNKVRWGFVDFGSNSTKF